MRRSSEAPWRKKLLFKRGGSSGGGSGGGGTTSASTSTETLYDDNPSGTHQDYDKAIDVESSQTYDLFMPDEYKEKFYQGVAKKLGVSLQEAQESLDAIYNFTYTGYEYMRQNDRANKKDLELQAVYKFLEKAPKYKGEVYRGLKFSGKESYNEFIDAFQVGKVNKLGELSSFSSTLSVAKGFSSSKYPVVIHVASNRSGASIKKFSAWSNEDEVLTPKGAKYRTKSIKEENGFTNIYVEEVR
jgi:hypothetical protein